ncbi:MAG: GNAT family N-acetyltransferase [Candidatus Obscuribacterales bacterium]|nr:GNAT family N-acetyltransferase [Cyanobacteria bacterium SZAS LIN-5]
MQAVVTDFRAEDRSRWTELWTAYLRFYKTNLPADVFDSTWERMLSKSGTLRGAGVRATESGPLLGIVHYLMHESAWTPKQMCYLQDLFVDADVRGQGLARLLIETVAQRAKDLDCYRCYWLTQESNAQARILYDKVGRLSGFVRYDFDYARSNSSPAPR